MDAALPMCSVSVHTSPECVHGLSASQGLSLAFEVHLILKTRADTPVNSRRPSADSSSTGPLAGQKAPPQSLPLLRAGTHRHTWVLPSPPWDRSQE